MKKTLLMSIIALAVSVAFVSGGIAQQKAAPAQKALWEKFRGVIEKVDEAKKEVFVQGEKEKMTFSVGEQTKISETTNKLPLSGLKKGMAVTVEYKKEGNKMLAEWIDVTKKVEATAEVKKEAPAPASVKQANPSEKASEKK
jgi:hypothetical protein